MKLLLHICCSNCALVPLPRLRDRGADVTGLWYNPNIHPVTEYRARRDGVRTLRELWRFELLERDVYGLVDFVRRVAGREADRCAECYRLRLEETAETAAREGFDAFSTTLLISPFQDQDLIRSVGDAMASRFNVAFHFEDFRDGFNDARQESRRLGLYRQKYCGCIYSEMERYLGRKGLERAAAARGSG